MNDLSSNRVQPRRGSLNRLGFYGALAMIILVSLWLRNAFPIYAIGTANHDDALFVKLAASIASGEWLGEYDKLTHAKGAGYPVFLALNHLVGSPLKLAEHFLYLVSALFFSLLVGELYKRKWVALACFALLAFVPTAWNAGVSGRVVRECLYVTLSLLLLGLGIRCFVLSTSAALADELRRKWPLLLAFGFVAGAYWLTREEGAWLFPAIIIALLHWLWTRRGELRAWRPATLFLMLPALSCSLVVGTVNYLNYQTYGVYRNTDFRSSDFVSAYGALSRIKHDNWQRYVVFPRDARQRAYNWSLAALELRGAFEGQRGSNWRRVGCEQTKVEPCEEILSGWFMWAFRDAVAAAGHYRSATEARKFYRRLAEQIKAGCDEHPNECLSARQTLVPPWRGHYLRDTVVASWRVFRTLITLGGAPVNAAPSVGSAEQLELFSVITNGPLAPADTNSFREAFAGDRMSLPVRIANIMAQIEHAVARYGVPLSIALLAAWCVLAAVRRRLDRSLVVALMLVAAVGSRVVLLGFLDATSIPSNNMLYLSPAVPMMLLLIPVVLVGFFDMAPRGGSHRRKAGHSGSV